MYTAVIVDDEQDAVEALSSLIHDYCKDLSLIGTAHSVASGLSEVLTKKPDIVFLDIEMGDGSGFTLLENIPDKKFSTIFVTAYHQYALQAIKQNALDYLLKPVATDELILAVEKAINSRRTATLKKQQQAAQEIVSLQKLMLPTLQGFLIVDINDIVYCRSEGSYVHFYYGDNRTCMVSRQLKEYEEFLSPFHFFRIHNSFLINLSKIREYLKADGGHVVMCTGAELPVSERRKAELLQKLTAFKV